MVEIGAGKLETKLKFKELVEIQDKYGIKAE
jgi:hypothetical protein